MNTNETEMMSKVELANTTIAVGGELIFSSNKATHVGVVRSVSGNSPHIAERLSAHRPCLVSSLLAWRRAIGQIQQPVSELKQSLECLSSSLAWQAWYSPPKKSKCWISTTRSIFKDFCAYTKQHQLQ